MRKALTVAWKEFRTFFQTPVGYVILMAFTLVGGFFFFKLGGFFVSKNASLRSLLSSLPFLFLFFAPAITMRLWAEERRAGTIETLLTLPLKDWEIVLGKYLAALGLVAVGLLCLTPMWGVVSYFGEPDRGPIIGGFVGALLLGGAYAAIGVASSAFTENQIISFVIGGVASFIFLLVGFDSFVTLFPDSIGSFFYNLSLYTHFESIQKGVLDSRDLLYYLSFIAFFLAVNVWAVRRPRGRGVTVAMTAAILLLVNYLGASHFERIDLTASHRYDLASDTKRILGNLEDNLRLTAYLSSDVPVEFSNTRRDIEDTVRELESYAKEHRLHVEIVDPSKSEANKAAAEKAGLKPAPLNVYGADKLEVKNAYIGIVLEFGDKSEMLPFVQPETLEYDLILRIAKMTRKGDVKVAWQVNDSNGGMNFPGMPRPPSQDHHAPSGDLEEMDRVFRQGYDVTTVDLKSKVPDEVKAIFLCNAGSLTEVQKFHLDQFLMRGGGVVAMVDGTEAQQGFGGMGGGSPFLRSAAQKLPDDFFSHYGFKINKNVIVDNEACLPIPQPVNIGGGVTIRANLPYPAIPVAIGTNIDQTHPLTAGLTNLGFLWASSIELVPKPEVKAFELAKSSHKAKSLEGFVDVSFSRTNEISQEKLQDQFLLAGLLEGNFQSYFLAHEVPKEIVEGKPASAESGGAPGDESGSPFGELTPPDDGTANAKSRAEPPKKDDAKKSGDGEKKTDGGPHCADDQDVPGGGLVRVQDAKPQEAKPQDAKQPDVPKTDGAKPPSDTAKPPADASKPGGDASNPAGDAAKPAAPPKKEFEYLKKSTAPGRIVVIGTSEFATNNLMGPGLHNDAFLNGVADYFTTEGLSTLRAKNLSDSKFGEPTDNQRYVTQALGWFAAPLLLLGLCVWTYVWRRSIRPANARRRMATGRAS